MAGSQLRVYYGPQADEAASSEASEASRPTVTLPLEEVLPLLADAIDSRRTWLRDFENDEITISTDLYEVLIAYRHYRRPSA